LTALLLLVPGALSPDPDTAKEWLRQELSRPDYQESLAERFTHWFDNLMGSIFSAGTGGLNPVVALVLLAVLAGGVALALSRLRANPTSGAHDAAVFSEARQSSEEHRRRAHAALELAQWAEAVVESVRALAAGLLERGLMPEQSGVTIHEISQRATTLFPAHQTRLEAMALLFDETRYGDRPAEEQQARAVVELERELATRSPQEAGARGPVSAVPR
jgi:Domain of unknown function (DUF4129)